MFLSHLWVCCWRSFQAIALTSLLIIPALFIRMILDLATDAILYAVDYGNKGYTCSIRDLAWADNYIYYISTIFIFVGLGIVGVMRPKVPTSAYQTQQRKNLGYAWEDWYGDANAIQRRERVVSGFDVSINEDSPPLIMMACSFRRSIDNILG